MNNIVRKIRTALGDSSTKPRFLQTVVGKGYRFIGPVRVIGPVYPLSTYPRSEVGSTEPVRDQSLRDFGVPDDRPSLAVLPLFLIGNSKDYQDWALGCADALISRLANLEGITVLPLSNVLNFPSQMAASEIASRLQIRFVVRGAIQISRGKSRLSVEMLDAQLQRTCFTQIYDLDVRRLFELEEQIANQIARSLNRPLRFVAPPPRPRYSSDPMAYAEFMRGYRLSSSGDTALLNEAAQRLGNAIARDPVFSLAHATLSYVCAMRHFEVDPASTWLEKAEFHCARAMELDPALPEAHVARAYLLWGPSKNFQHLQAIAELKRALSIQKNLPHAYNRLGTILAHVGLLDRAREMYERARPFDQKKTVSHSIVQVYVWSGECDLAQQEIQAWRSENPGNKYAIYFAPQPAMMSHHWDEAKSLLDEALHLVPDEPLIVSLQGVFYALLGKEQEAMACLNQACASPKSFGHAHHTYYQLACILALLGRRKAAFDWLERSVSSGFACWPYFIKDPCLQNVRGMEEFEVLVSSLQARYPDHLGLL